MDMVGAWQWKDWWGRWKLRMWQLVRYNRLRRDYQRITCISPRVAGSWMDGEARLLILSEKEVETVGSEPCQRKFFY